MKIFPKTGGKSTERAKIEGKIRNLWSMTKNKSSDILAADENLIFSEKVKL